MSMAESATLFSTYCSSGEKAKGNGVISGGRAWPGEKISFSSACLFWGQNGKEGSTLRLSLSLTSRLECLWALHQVIKLFMSVILCLNRRGFCIMVSVSTSSAEGFALCYHCPLFHGLNA